MTEFIDLPDGWDEVIYEVGPSRGTGPYVEEFDAVWASEDEEILVLCRHTVDPDGTVTYPMTVEQMVEAGGYRTEIQTHSRIADNRKEAEELAVDFMDEVADGEHRYHVMDIDEVPEKSVVRFFTICDSSVPGDVTADEVIEIVTNDEFEDVDEDEVPDEIYDEVDPEQMIQVDIFPRHMDQIETVDEQ